LKSSIDETAQLIVSLW